MRKTVLFVIAWLAAGIVAIAVASMGVSMVGNQVTGDRPAPLSAAEVRAELASGTATTAPPGPTPGSTPTTTTPGPTPEPTSTTPTSTPAPTADPGAVDTRTYATTGGTVTLRFAPGGVSVVAATPNAGFSVETEAEHGTGVRVEFEADHHRSRVTGWWDGAPRDEVREDD